MTTSPVVDDDDLIQTIPYNPYVGAQLPNPEILIDDQAVRIYANAVGDEGFAAFQASVVARHGIKVAPPMILDRDLTARHVGGPGRTGFHGKQGFTFNAPMLVGETYRLRGEVTEVLTKRGADYFVTESMCSPLNDPKVDAVKAKYTRAYRFPGNQYPRSAERPKQRLTEWLAQSGALAKASFPAVGTVIEGRTQLYDQAQVNLYSDQDAGIHTDNRMARERGLEGTVVQALMATELTCRVYRDLFGLAFLRRGQVDDIYIEPILCGVSLRSAVVVQSVTDELITLKSAVATTTGLMVAVGTAEVRHWLTDDDVDE